VKKKRIFGFCLIAFIILSLSGCVGSLSDETVRRMLDDLLKSDLSVILDGLQEDGVLDEPFFEIVEWRSFDEGIFRHWVEVHFYFLSDVRVKVIRRYRYNRRHLRWERFHNVYERF